MACTVGILVGLICFFGWPDLTSATWPYLSSRLTCKSPCLFWLSGLLVCLLPVFADSGEGRPTTAARHQPLREAAAIAKERAATAKLNMLQAKARQSSGAVAIEDDDKADAPAQCAMLAECEGSGATRVWLISLDCVFFPEIELELQRRSIFREIDR